MRSTLEFSKQSASVSNRQFIEIIYQNFGFDLENGVNKGLYRRRRKSVCRLVEGIEKRRGM